jgi:hypothetical protein
MTEILQMAMGAHLFAKLKLILPFALIAARLLFVAMDMLILVNNATTEISSTAMDARLPA